MNFTVEVICLTDGNGKPVPRWTRPILLNHASYSSLEEAIQKVMIEGDWEAIGPPIMVGGHSAVITVRKEKNLCSIHIMPERNVSLK